MFASLKLSKKLSEMECVSESRFYAGRLKDVLTINTKETDCIWYDIGHDGKLVLKRVSPYLMADGINVFNHQRDMIFCQQLFHPWDFIANTEQARENASIIWANGESFTDDEAILGDSWGKVEKYSPHQMRHRAIDAEDFWALIEESLK